jgi:hypothetical protein
MNIWARLTIVSFCTILCLTAALRYSNSPEGDCNRSAGDKAGNVSLGDYQFAAGGAASESAPPSWKVVVQLVRRDAAAKSVTTRVEFNSLSMEGNAALVQVVLINDKGLALPFVYKLVPEHGSWKVASAERLWFVRPSRLLRGVRV